MQHKKQKSLRVNNFLNFFQKYKYLKKIFLYKQLEHLNLFMSTKDQLSKLRTELCPVTQKRFVLMPSDQHQIISFFSVACSIIFFFKYLFIKAHCQ